MTHANFLLALEFDLTPCALKLNQTNTSYDMATLMFTYLVR